MIKDNITGNYFALDANQNLIAYLMNADDSMGSEDVLVDFDALLHEMPLNIDGKEIDLYVHICKIYRRLMNTYNRKSELKTQKEMIAENNNKVRKSNKLIEGLL